ncbi:MAG: magnesium/cobalt transporter CorA [Bacteroidales bacterium]|nr:magnesium/cobalt transporter CorA [Bacteroidales bacterium]MBN2819751.1 magnesium/cobalt transporter CorA [Bacteroidales bacterium]
MPRFIKNRQKSHGKVPGSVIFMGKQKMDKPRINVIRYNKTTLEEFGLDEIYDIKNHVSTEFVTWINIDGLHDTYLIENLGEQFEVSSLVLEDIVNTDQRPIYLKGDNYLALILKSLFYLKEDSKIQSEQISFILTENCLITLQERIGDFFEPVRERIRKKRGRIVLSGADYLCYSLIDSLIDSYFFSLENLGVRIENIEDKILKNFDKKILEEIYILKSDLNYMRKLCMPIKEILSRLAHSPSPHVNDKTIKFLVDLEDLGIQVNEIIDSYSTMLTDQLNLFNSILSNKANEVMKVLTIFASIFIPLTFIAGIYGTNFDYLPELHFKYSYPIMWGVMIGIVAAMFVFFKKQKWF